MTTTSQDYIESRGTSSYRLSDLIDLTIIQKMADAHYRAAGMPIGIIDALDGSILVGSGWQDICVKFHRTNPISLRRCQDSDNYIKDRLIPGEACRYKCKNGLWDFGIPIMVAERHLATMFLGQFFYDGETPDRESFVQLANELGFDVGDYLAALDRVPVFSREKVEYILEYDKALVGFIADLAERALVERREAQIIRDSERMCLEAARRSEAELRSFVEKSPFGIFRSSVEEDRFLSVNPALIKMLGYASEQEIFSLKISAHLYREPHDRDKAIAMLLRDQIIDIEAPWRRKDGSILIAHFNGRLVESAENGSIFEAIVEDVTEREHAEKALRESEERFRRVVEGAPVGMYIQTEGIFRYFNPAAVAMLGAESADQLIGRGFLEIIHPDCRAAVTERARLVLGERKAVPFLEERLLRLDGTVFDAEVTAVPFVFQGRDGALVFIRDITERRRDEDKRRVLEQQLRQAQKMEAVGRLAGGIAHDFNNLLMVIQSYTEMLQDSLSDHDSLRKNTEQVLKAAERGASLTSQMLAFSRKQIISPVVLDLAAVVRETAKMLKRLLGEDIEIQMNLPESLWTIKADSSQMVQILMNLCVNARDAMPQGGTLTVSAENVDLKNDVQSYIVPGEYVKLSVADTGVGISKEQQEHIFEPFFTTKEIGKGTGLGLATVYGIVKQSSGYVWVQSTPGDGTRFTICLPRAGGTIATSVPAKSTIGLQGSETILIAEDECALREAMCEYLRNLGYTVLAAGTGQHALSVANEHQGSIDLLITDVVMPRMSGRELSHLLGLLRPNIKTIYMSGYTDDAGLRQGIEDSDATLVQKPFSLATLARKLRLTLRPCDVEEPTILPVVQ